MARKSSVKALPDGVVKAINFQLQKERLTLDDLVDWLRREHGFEISRSALGRYSKEYSDLRAELTKTREIAESFARELGPENVSGKQGALLVEMMHSMLMRFMQDELTPGGPLDEDKQALTSKNFMELCRSIKDISQANRFNQDFQDKLRAQIIQEERDRALQKTAALEKEISGTGATAEEVLKRIRQDIYGIVERPSETGS